MVKKFQDVSTFGSISGWGQLAAGLFGFYAT